ncbi:hypothetical protein QQ045_000258 [Rhodiola kirilowii]
MADHVTRGDDFEKKAEKKINGWGHVRIQLDSKHEAATAFADAGHRYKKTNLKEAVSCLEQAVNSFRLYRYQKAVEIYEDIARQSLNNNLLIEDLDPTFSGTREYKLLADITSAIDEENVAKFTDCVKEFDSMTRYDARKTTLLLRVKEKLKAKEMEEDGLT